MRGEVVGGGGRIEWSGRRLGFRRGSVGVGWGREGGRTLRTYEVITNTHATINV